MMAAASQACILLVCTLTASPAAGLGSFRKAESNGTVEPDQVREDLMSALSRSLNELGTGGLDVQEIGKRIWGTFNSLPKSKDDQIGDAAVEYLTHSFYLKEYGWLIRGLDPHQRKQMAMESGNDTQAIPDNYNDIPGFLAILLAGRQGIEDGMSLSRAVAYIATLGNLILHEGIKRVEMAYSLNGFLIDSLILESELETVMDSYMILLASENDDMPTRAQHKEDRDRLHQMWLEFSEMEAFSGDVVRSTGWKTDHLSNPFHERGYSFEESFDVMTLLAQQYGKVRDVQCHQLKDGLVEMDTGTTGRVLLKDFYAKRSIGSWTLGESVEYLRGLGALDETAPGLGPQLIISNYVTAVSNCDSPSDYYSICCIHECNDLLNQLESAIQAPAAQPEEVLALVANLSSDTVVAPRNLSAGLVGALEKVAQVHNGQVPLHSRLFAQWLHYTFPHECPYPHIAGRINPLTPNEWFKQYNRTGTASEQEVELALRVNIDEPAVATEWYMSQWTADEESLSDGFAMDTSAKPKRMALRKMLQVVAFALGPLSVFIGLVWNHASTARSLMCGNLGFSTKMHNNA